MNVNLRQVRSFLSVARFGSFTRAAHVLHLSQPALTKQIRQLEESLGVRLLDRNTRAVHLTRVGRELAPTFQRLLQEFDAVLVDTNDLAAKRHGVVRLACLPSYAATILPEQIAAFRAQHPRVSFVLKDAVWRRIVAMVRSEEVDFGIGAAETNEPDLEIRELLEDRMHVVFPAGHPIEDIDRVTIEELANYPLVLMDPESSVRHMIDAAFAAAGRLAVPACEATYMSTAVGMVRAELGLSIIPSTAIELRAHSGVRSRPIDDAGFVRRIALIRKEGRSILPAAEAFVQMLLDGTATKPRDRRSRPTQRR